MNPMNNTELVKVVRVRTKPKITRNAISRAEYINNDTRKGMQILEVCNSYWNGLYSVRLQRRINRNFRNGIQWTAQELKDIAEMGGMAITQNICALLVRNMLGQYWSNKTSPVAVARKIKAAEESGMLSLAIENVIKINGDEAKDARNLEEIMLSGIACCRTGFSWHDDINRNDVMTININLDRLIFNTDIEDQSLNNLHTIGEICDDTFDGMVCKFAKTQSDIDYLEQIYTCKGIDRTLAGQQDSTKLDNLDFYTPLNPDNCRYFEVWQKERRKVVKYHDYATGTMGVSEYSTKELQIINDSRIAAAALQGIAEDEIGLIDYEDGFEQVWVAYYIAPNGAILKEIESPYLHGQHPYTLMLHTMIDGHIHPMLSDIIPQQRYMNHLIQMLDFSMGRAAKGVLLIPESCITDEVSLKDIAEQWTKFNGVIKLTLKPGVPMPQQIVANVQNYGAREMFDLQLNLSQQIFGVNQAIQGQQPASGTPASRYLQETQNSSLNSKDLFEMFSLFKKQKYHKIMCLIKQYYTEKRFIQVSGKSSNNSEVEFDPERVSNLDFDIDVSSANNSPSYQIAVDDQMFKFVELGLIDLETALQNSGASYAPKLLEDLRKKKEEAQKQQMLAQGGGQQQPVAPQNEDEEEYRHRLSYEDDAPYPNGYDMEDEAAMEEAALSEEDYVEMINEY